MNKIVKTYRLFYGSHLLGTIHKRKSGIYVAVTHKLLCEFLLRGDVSRHTSLQYAMNRISSSNDLTTGQCTLVT